jgi:integrin alpha FG-GAP repeat containing protein 1
MNERMLDANFLKIVVTSGRCQDGKCYKQGILEKEYRVAYGTNQPGPFVSYNFLDVNGNRKMSCSGQLSQSGYFSLQVPYLIFGLGSYANFIDELWVTVPSNSTLFKRSHLWEQLVPDAQVIVIPHPPDSPKQWITKLFLTPSDIVFQMGYVLLGICVGLVLIVAIFHRKEAIEDRTERQEFRGQFRA